MIDVRNLPEEIASLDKMIESFEGQLNEIRQQRALKIALLHQLQSPELSAVGQTPSVEQGANVISE